MNSVDELTVNKTLRPELRLVAETRADSSICCDDFHFCRVPRASIRNSRQRFQLLQVRFIVLTPSASLLAWRRSTAISTPETIARP
jgi:hypothetical protein